MSAIKSIPKIRELSEEYSELLFSKKIAYSEYRKIRDEAQELIIAERNIDALYDAEKKEEQRMPQNEKQH